MRERLDAVSRATSFRTAETTDEPNAASIELPLRSLPSLKPRRAIGRLMARLGELGAPTLDARRALSAYWRATERNVRHWQIWRLNPVTLAWNLARDLKNLAVFVANMSQERY
jgi:hypothetical protein